MTESQILSLIRESYGAMLVSAAAQFSHRPEVLAGIMARESEGGTSRYLDQPGPAGRGDHGHGHGLCQIDDRSFPEFCASDNWKDPAKNIDMAAWILQRKRAYLKNKLLGFGIPDDEMERAAIAAYNCGEGNEVRAIRAGLGFDYYTANQNYSAEVLRLAGAYASLVAESTYLQ